MPENDEIAEKARQMGHISQDDWIAKGKDPEKWRPAAEFVERSENIIPIMRKEMEKLRSELKIATAYNKQEIEQVRKQAHDEAMRQYQAKILELEQKELDAFKNGDADAFVSVKNERAQLKKPEQPENNNNEDPFFTNWKDKNPWYTADKELADYADFISHKIVQEHHGNIGKIDLAEEMTNRTKSAFPHKFDNPRRKEVGAVEGSNNISSENKGAKTFKDLPDSARATYKRLAEKFKAQGREFTKEQYAQSYFAQG